ncbi:MAG: hypothetical protein GKC10_03175 [Methanosarcinales archaeon]|nr:hypothetical protein [Methanosarcinales archaeon]
MAEEDFSISRQPLDMKVRIHRQKFDKRDFCRFVLGADIGGTHTNLAVAGAKDGEAALIFSTHFLSQELDSIIPALRATLDLARERYGIEVEQGCAGIAGPVVEAGRARPTNVAWEVDGEEATRETGMEELILLNDFQIIGYGIQSIQDEDLFPARGGQPEPGQTRAVLGAGTGLGKAVLVFDGQSYRPLSSEGGHGDFPIHDRFDLELAEYVRGGRETPASYEDLLSGRGIVRIYQFLKEKRGATEYSSRIEEAGDRAAAISGHRECDPLSRETFRIYARYYGRCAKNFVLDAMCTGGLYIAGGIASRNREIFKSPEFQGEFLKAERQRHILERVPVNVIVNYDVSLHGACNAAVLLGKVRC